MQQKRENWVDFAKGIGILLVVYGHVSRGIVNAGMAVDLAWFTVADSVIYSFHMPLFFSLSGLFLLPGLKKYGSRGLVAEKIDSILYPYLIWSLLQGGTEVLLSHFTTARTNMTEVLSLLWQPRAQFWFLYVLSGLFVLMAITLRQHQPVTGRSTLLAVGGALAAWCLSVWLALPFPLDFMGGYLIFFLMGAYGFYWKDELHRYLAPYAMPLLIASGLLFVSAEWLFHVPLRLLFSDHSPLNLLLACSGIMLVNGLAMSMARSGIRWLQIFETLGYYSMPVYLMHILAGSGIRIVLSRFLHIDSTWLHLLAGCAAGILLPVFVFRLTQQPARRPLQYLFRPPAWLSFKPDRPVGGQ